nr:DNA mismatch repair protein MSH4-like [Ipomoea batatas]GMD70300.1 DNA mismatch repair protein MSH4-like [Ipomoea batatas]
MEDDNGERSSFVIGLIENRAKEVGVAAFDLRSASLHLSQYIETSSSYQNTKTLLEFYEPMVIIVPPNKLAADGMVGVSQLADRFFSTIRKVIMARGCFDDTRDRSRERGHCYKSLIAGMCFFLLHYSTLTQNK